MNTGIITAAKRSQSGKTIGVKIGDRWYQTKNWALEHAVGRKLNYEVTTSEYNGQTFYWLDKESLATDPGGPDAPPPAPSNTAPRAQAPASSFDPGQALPMTSNIVAHAIQAGLCKQPADVPIWAQAAFVAARGLLTTGHAEVSNATAGTYTTTGPEDGYDDDIPF